MGNCCSTDATHTIPRSGPPPPEKNGLDEIPTSTAAYAAIPPSPRKYTETESTEPHAKDEEPSSSSPSPSPSSASPPQTVPEETTQAANRRPSQKHIENTHHVKIGDYNLRYSYYSKRGYYPEARKKANQDSYYCETHFAGDDQKAFFAVFDGHGQYGDICSQFAAEQLPENILKNLEENMGILPALTRAHVQTNRADERVRVKKCGARILTVDQVEGLEPIHENWGLTLGEEIDENGDPPRIWHPYGQYPVRHYVSLIGDLVSEELGVTAEPEILCKGLNPHDKFIVVASDGVFEFLTSQNVVDIVKQYDNPSEACHALVEEAYNRWLQFEVRTDDITAICIYLDGVTPAKERDGPRGSIYVGGEVLDLQSMQRPVRGITKNHARRNTIVGTDAIRLSLAEAFLDDDDDSDERRDLVENGGKSEEEEEWIKQAVQGNFLFNHLSDQKVSIQVYTFEGGWISRNKCLITGEFEARHVEDESPELSPENDKELAPEKYGEVVHVYKSGPEMHPTFGELALIYSKPRANTIITKEKGTLWLLDRIAFRSILVRGRPLRDVIRRLRQISLLRPLTAAQTNLVAEEMRTVVFEPNQVVLHEGMTEPGFFLITSGRIESTSKMDNVAPLELKTFDYFGEIALVRRRSISQRTIRALERTECLFIRKDALELAVGKLSSILEKDKIRRSRKERISESRHEATTTTFVQFDKEPKPGMPQSIDELEVVGSVLSDLTNTVRLVEVKGASPPMYLTLRSVSKQAIVDASMQKHICGERDIYVSLYEKNALVPHVVGMNSSESDIHVLYDTQIVGSLETFLDSEPHGESFVRYYAAQVVMALEFLHSEGIVSRMVDPTNLMVDRSGNLRMINLRYTSAELKDIVEKLLNPDLARRLGFSDVRGGACEAIKKHAFFAGTSWEATKIGSFAVRCLAASLFCRGCHN
ncbi:hypothetical protein BBJ28_00018122 [Nothophytophthora sp. Chile5]|nr:hypothetical protein BBJ28_00018122 [Nothophytophthora sp. Chile5]